MRYLRNIFLLSLLLTVFLPAAGTSATKLTFQGYVAGSDGSGYTGQISTKIQAWSASKNGTLIISSGEQNGFEQQNNVNVTNGNYTLVLNLNNDSINKLMQHKDLYLEIQLKKANDTTQFGAAHLLSPRVHLLGVPIALKARGVSITKNSTLAVGNVSNISNIAPDGIVVGAGNRIGIGTNNPAEALHVSANGTYAIVAERITGNGIIYAGRVEHVKWE
jgi:hypothetical protein